jgi:hypothetical protein
VAESEPKTPRKPTYLQPVALDPICFLQEVLYWVAFGRLPIIDPSRNFAIEGYETDLPQANGELMDEECDRVDLPRDPRGYYDWAFGVMLSDQIEEITTFRESVETETAQDESGTKEHASREVEKLHAEMMEWKPKFERVIELPASEVYAMLRKGRLTSKGVRLPDPDVAVSLKMLAEQNKQLGELEPVAIPKDFWSLPNIYWEISAARNETEHYCHIYCPTDELMSLFPVDTVTKGESVDVVHHGSFFVLSPTSTTAAAPPRRSQGRNRRGRPPEYRWNDLHVEMAELVSKGLPAKEDSAVAHLREAYRKRFGDPVPGHRTLYDWVKPYYERFCGNSDS